MNRIINAGLAAVVAFTFATRHTAAGIIFDNGPVDAARTTWNDGHPNWTIYDDFVLDGDTTITGLRWSIFTLNASSYASTYVSIFDGIEPVSNAVIPEFNAVATITPNGLVSTNPFLPNGFDQSLDSLSINLAAGTYFLGIRTETNSGGASIGSGPGSAQTIGPGLFQASGTSPAGGGLTKTGDHMAFQVLTSSPVPEPASMALFGLGSLGIGIIAHRRKRRMKS